MQEVTYLWRLLGIYLGIDPDKLTQIQADHGGGAKKVDNWFASVLEEWKKGDPEKFNKEKLVDALRNISHGLLANKVETCMLLYKTLRPC